MTLGEYVNAYCTEHNLSMREFAKMSGISHAYISMIVNGRTPRGNAPKPSIDNYRKAAGIECTAHQLRHSFASLLHSAGVDAKDAQTLMGHSSIVVTQDIYTKIEQGHKEEVREAVNDYIKAMSSKVS